MKIPLDFHHGQEPKGFVEHNFDVPNLHEYWITPVYDLKTKEVINYSLVHRKLVTPVAEMEKIERGESPYA